MEPKAFILQNTGMNRDLSVSKTGKASAYENFNIRIEAREDSTELSVTNERGTRLSKIKAWSSSSGKYVDSSLDGSLVGWCVLDNHVILFVTGGSDDNDRIYRCDYIDGDFYFKAGPPDNEIKLDDAIAIGQFNFSTDYPIEAIAYYESSSVQKIYWVDGHNTLRCINIAADEAERLRWNADSTYFDVNRKIAYGVYADVKKDNSGNTRPNGVIQYMMTYYNRFGQESACVWVSDLIYLTPEDHGGAQDETNNNRITLEFNSLDSDRWNGIRVYSVLRTTLDNASSAFLVGEYQIDSTSYTVVDDGAHLTSIVPSQLLFLGSQPVSAGTITHKDGTLFLGDIKDLENNDGYGTLQTLIETHMMQDGWKANSCLEFVYSGVGNNEACIPYKINNVAYEYESQIYSKPSSEITTFKSGEKYRFALVFLREDGTRSKAFWIGDKVNTLYPKMTQLIGEHVIERPIVKVTLPALVQQEAERLGFVAVQLEMAEATYADRAVKAQGIVNPSMFNLYERTKGRVYAYPSWISRPRRSDYAWKHFSPVHSSTTSTGEIQCNYWNNGEQEVPTPYYRIIDYDNENASINGVDESEHADYLMCILELRCTGIFNKYSARVHVLKAYAKTNAAEGSVEGAEFGEGHIEFTHVEGYFSSGLIATAEGTAGDKYALYTMYSNVTLEGEGTGNNSKSSLYASVCTQLRELDVPEQYIMDVTQFYSLCNVVSEYKGDFYFFNYKTGNTKFADLKQALNLGGTPTVDRWYKSSDIDFIANDKDKYSYNNKNLMFVDENIVTLNSPEIEYGKASIDNSDSIKFRIVGAAKIDGKYSDFVVDATQGHLAGQNLVPEKFYGTAAENTLHSLLSWPLWSENDLSEKDEEGHVIPIDVEDMTPSDYNWGSSIVRYWLYMWQKAGSITGYSEDYSVLKKKVFANMHFSHETLYVNTTANVYPVARDDVRLYDGISNVLTKLSVGNNSVMYSGYSDLMLSMPSNKKYPIVTSSGSSDVGKIITADGNVQLYSNSPVVLSFISAAHAVISLKSKYDDEHHKYIQTILPITDYGSERVLIPERDTTGDPKKTGGLLPWLDSGSIPGYNNTILLTFPDALWDHLFVPSRDASQNIETGPLADCIFWWERHFDTSSPGYFMQAVKDKFGTRDVFVYTRETFRDNGVDVPYVVHIGIDPEKYPYDSIRNGWVCSGENLDETYLADYDPSDFNPDIDVDEFECVYDTVTQEWSFTYIRTRGYNYSHPEEILPTIGGGSSMSDGYAFTDYDISYYSDIAIPNLTTDDQYLLIGELYYDYDSDPAHDPRYGGINPNDVKNNRFIPISPRKVFAQNTVIYGVQGDTYFQRWDCLKTKPSNSAVNQVIDVTSFMVETHIDIDGVTNKNRGTSYLASVDIADFNNINPVYSQTDNFKVDRIYDDPVDRMKYRSSITWTLPKTDLADVDEWMHITLASSLTLDGDKGICRAIRRYRNRLIAFQDKGIAEILFNSRTQLTTTDGVPIEIANSEKVDGKRYISNSNGCKNKWSIAEGKAALYFFDGINKEFCRLKTGDNNVLGIEDLSGTHGFGTWFRSLDDSEWNIATFNNVISFYDRLHSDVYIVRKKGDNDDRSCLVFNERLDSFTSFYSYNRVPMMANVCDDFISFKNGGLWNQNKGLYNYYHNELGDSYVIFRASPEPYSDKVWTNLEYRTDFYEVLDENGDSEIAEGDINTSSLYSMYKANETFDTFSAWTEYQHTPDFNGAKKKFRIWNVQLPRAIAPTGSFKRFDRIRNPWVFLKLQKTYGNSTSEKNQYLMQMHDAIIKYFE